MEEGEDVLAQMEEPTSICLVCNRTFPMPKLPEDTKPNIKEAEELRKLDECFAINFGLSSEEMTRVSFFTKPNRYPFCPRCTPMAKNLLKLQAKLTQIREKLARATIDVAAIIVNTYVYTVDESPFFDMKNLIFEKWYDKIDEFCAQEEKIFDMSTKLEDENLPSKSEDKKPNVVSREVAILKKKGKGDVKPISIDEEEVEEVTCAVCNKIYRSKEYLKLHMKSHTGETRPYSCSLCEKTFFGSSTLKKHLKAKHGSKEEIVTKVETPAPPSHSAIETQFAKVTMENGEEAHLIIGRRVETPPPKLEDETATSIEIDEDEFIYFEEEETPEPLKSSSEHGVVCSYCEKRFATKVTLTKHVRTVHLKTIKVECPICKMTTRDHYNLSKHISSHDPKLTKLSYNCPLCGAGFHVRRELLGHYKKIHKLDLMRETIPQPIIRALAENEPMEMSLQDQKQDPVPTNTGMGTGNTGLSNNDGLPLIKIKREEILSADGSKPVVATVPSIFLKRKKKRRRRPLLTFSNRAQLMRHRARTVAAKLSPIKVESEPTVWPMNVPPPGVSNAGSFGVKLNILPEMMVDNLESDEALVEAAKRCHPDLLKLNFSAKLKIEKVQIVLPSPEREDEDDSVFQEDLINGVLQYSGGAIPEVPGISDGYSPTKEIANSTVKIYGPKSKLAEIRSRKLKLHVEEETFNVSEEPRQIESKKIEAVIESQVPQFKPRQLRTYSGPKTKMAVNTCGQHISEIPNLTQLDGKVDPPNKSAKLGPANVERNGSGQPVVWKTIKPFLKQEVALGLKRPVGQILKSNRPNDVLPTPTASISQDGRALILKTIPTIHSYLAGLTTSAAPRGTQQRFPMPSSPPKLQPAPHRVGYLEDASRTLHSPTAPLSSTPTLSLLLAPKKSPAKYPLPNQQLAQIAKSFRKHSRRHGGTASGHPAKAKVSEMARQLIKSGVANPKAIPFGRTSSATSTSGPIIETTHSMGRITTVANPKAIPFGRTSSATSTSGPIIETTHAKGRITTTFSLGNGDASKGSQRTASVVTTGGTPSIHNPDLVAAFHKSPEGKTDQVEALMRNSHIDVSIVSPVEALGGMQGPPVPDMSSPFAMPRLPSGITLVQVEDVLKGNTPKKDELLVLSPTPKRRFILPKGINNRAVKFAKLSPAVSGLGGLETNQTEFESPNGGKISIRSMSSLTDPLSPEEVEPYEPESVLNFASPEMRIGNDYPLERAPAPVYSAAQTRTPPLKTVAYRPFPRNESIRIMKYSEHIRVRQQQEQEQRRFQQQPGQPPVQLFRPTVSPVTTSNVIYFPVQPVFRIQDSDPTFPP